jgi:hypothetical protein
MTRGKKPIVRGGTKQIVEEYFAAATSLREAWTNAVQVAQDYDSWHRQQAQLFGAVLRDRKCLGHPQYDADVVAAKCIDTFMHQLMKYEPCRALWRHLHLPLDARVLASLRRWKSDAARTLWRQVGRRSPYTLSYDDYSRWQNDLWKLVEELNGVPGAEVTFVSRVELNFLWL